MDPLDRINVSGDSTYMLMLEACRRGHTIAWCTPEDMFVVDGATHAHLRFVRSPKKNLTFILAQKR